MADDVTIKNFLVRLGFKTDEASLSKFELGIKRGTMVVVALGTAVEAMAIKVASAVTHFSANLEQLYFMSRRVGDSATNIKSFAAAITNLGGSSSGAMASMENLAKFLRENPSGEGWLGVMTRDAQGNMLQLSEIMTNLAHQFQQQPSYYAAWRANSMGIDDRTLQAMRSGDYEKELAEQKNLIGKDSFDKPAKDAHQFQENLRNFGGKVETLLLPVQTAIQAHLQGALEKLVAYLEKNGSKIADRMGKLADVLMVFLDKLTAWFIKHGDTLADDLVKGLTGLLDIIEFLAPKLGILAGWFKKADDATNGWLSRITLLIGVFKLLGGNVFGTFGAIISAMKNLGGVADSALGEIGRRIIGTGAFQLLRGATGVGLAAWTGWEVGSALNQWFGLDSKIGEMFTKDGAVNVKNALERVGYDPKEAAALTAIGYAENGQFDPLASGDNGAHIGLWQLDYNRQENFKKQKGYYINSYEARAMDRQKLIQDQADFHWWETHGGDKGMTDAYNQTHRANDVTFADMVSSYIAQGQRPGNLGEITTEVKHALAYAEALKQAVANSEAITTTTKAQKDSLLKPKPDRSNDTSSNNFNQEVNISVNGADDPKRVASLVLDGQRRANASITRNFVPNLV